MELFSKEKVFGLVIHVKIGKMCIELKSTSGILNDDSNICKIRIYEISSMHV